MARESVMRLARRHRERTTGSILGELHAEGWAVFLDVRWPGSRRSSVHHVAVGPPGIFVIDAKNWAGRIEVKENSFWCRGRRQDRAIGMASESALAIAGLVSGPASSTVRSALCFEREEPVVGWCYDVMLCSTSNVREMLTRRPPMLTADEITLASIELDLGFRAAPAEAPAKPPKVPRTPKIRRSMPRSVSVFRRLLMRVGILLLMAILLLTQVPRLVEIRESLTDRVKHAFSPESLVPDVAFESCDALRAIYPNGVGTAAAVRTVERKRWLPAVHPEAYRDSAALDTDGDGIVCERER